MKTKISSCLLLVLIFSLYLINQSTPSSIDPSNPPVRIGIVQHFGKSENDVLNIRSTTENAEFEVLFPIQSKMNNGNSQFQSRKLKSLEVKTIIQRDPPEELLKQSARVIAGAYRTYESAFSSAQTLKREFPQLNWQVLYPGPWEVSVKTNNPQALMGALLQKGFKSAWVREKTLSKKVLSWKPSSSESNYFTPSLYIRNVDGKPLKINKKTYAGTIEIIPDSFGTYSVVNELPIEEYLRGVVPFEIGADAPIAALETQAILARTYTLANLNRFLPENYNLCATQHCQVYGGLGAINKNIDRAIISTKGMVLKDGYQIAQIFYYSTDGGHSADFQDIWPASNNQRVQSLIGIKTCSRLPANVDLSDEQQAKLFITSKDAKETWGCYDAVSPSFRWEKKIELSKLAKNMSESREKWKFAWPEFREVKDIQVRRRSRNGRVTALSVMTDRGEFSIERDEVRAALGGLKSSFFIIDKEINPQNNDQTLILKGAGFGHGVGLSQFGARNLAAQGASVEQILRTYFPNYRLAHISR